MNTKVIYKFELEPAGKLVMPEGAKILHVEAQREIPMVWALVDPEVTNHIGYKLEVYPTGYVFPSGLLLTHKYLGTFTMLGMTYVYHVFVPLSLML